jgi:hypothetical protein
MISANPAHDTNLDHRTARTRSRVIPTDFLPEPMHATMGEQARSSSTFKGCSDLRSRVYRKAIDMRTVGVLLAHAWEVIAAGVGSVIAVSETGDSGASFRINEVGNAGTSQQAEGLR